MAVVVVSLGARLTTAAPALVTPAAFAACAAAAVSTEPPEYYAIELVPTGRVPGTGSSEGLAQVTFARSPFGVALSPTGAYVQALDIRLRRMRPTVSGVLAVWAASADLRETALLGVLGDELRLQGTVAWNKFLVVVSLEPSAEDLGVRWQGPIVMRGMSRSGMMHTLAGHGPFEAESCLKYGYK
jgi:hypothetical protein